MKRSARNVFINVPFDAEYEPLLEALVFTITACGFRVRCALESDDSGNVRLDKLDELIRTSAVSIHDLSRVELNAELLPRFNMPFELGLAVGAKRFGERRKDNRIKIMVREPYRMPAYLSDLAGNDPSAHRNKPDALIKIVRDFLRHDPSDRVLPGAQHLTATFAAFRKAVPGLAERIKHRPDEIGGLENFSAYLWCVAEFLRKGQS